MSVSVEVMGRDRLLATFSRLRPLVAQRVRDAVNASALAIQGGARRRAPVDTGRLRSSIAVKFYLGGLAGWIGTDLEYGAAVEFGTGLYGPEKRAYTIVPTRAKVLSWVGKDGQRVFATKVTIKGMKPQPYLGPAYDEEAPKFEQAIVEAVDRGLRTA